MNGYLNIVTKATDTPEQNSELTPLHIASVGILRVVLTWGEKPVDLDSHMLGPVRDGANRFHIFFSNRDYYESGEQIVNLDRDDKNSYGPETVTVYELNETGTYSYYVFDFTNRGDKDSVKMGELSKAKVKVYDEGNLVTTFSIPYGEAGTCWHVFDYDAATRQVIPVNTMSYLSLSSDVGMLDNAGSSPADGQNQLDRYDIQTILEDMEEKESNE